MDAGDGTRDNSRSHAIVRLDDLRLKHMSSLGSSLFSSPPVRADVTKIITIPGQTAQEPNLGFLDGLGETDQASLQVLRPLHVSQPRTR